MATGNILIRCNRRLGNRKAIFDHQLTELVVAGNPKRGGSSVGRRTAGTDILDVA
jgi:hypothetical protein